MSLKVLVVPEDPTYNGYILRPLVGHMLQQCGKPNARITVLTNPKANGYEHAKTLIRDEIAERYSHFNVILFLPDEDGRDKAGEFAALEDQATNKGIALLCCAAVPEVEVWLLSSYVDSLPCSWQEVRSHPSLKEHIFAPFLSEYGDSRRPGGGRDLLMGKTLQNYTGLLQRCPELSLLQNRLQDVLNRM